MLGCDNMVIKASRAVLILIVALHPPCLVEVALKLSIFFILMYLTIKCVRMLHFKFAYNWRAVHAMVACLKSSFGIRFPSKKISIWIIGTIKFIIENFLFLIKLFSSNSKLLPVSNKFTYNWSVELSSAYSTYMRFKFWIMLIEKIMIKKFTHLKYG